MRRWFVVRLVRCMRDVRERSDWQLAIGSRQEAKGEGWAAEVVEFSVDYELAGQYYIQ